MNYLPGDYASTELRVLAFDIERIMDKQRIANIELDIYHDQKLDSVVIEMVRRLAVVRLCFERPGTSSIENKTMDVRMGFHCPASWWDHFKLAHPRLCRFFGDPRMQTVTRVKDVEYDTIHRHYDNVAVVLNDQTELPKAMRTLEVKYEA